MGWGGEPQLMNYEEGSAGGGTPTEINDDTPPPWFGAPGVYYVAQGMPPGMMVLPGTPEPEEPVVIDFPPGSRVRR